MRTTIVRSWSAMAVGVAFTLVTCFVLMDDILRHNASVTTKHVMTLAVLFGAIYFGHRWWLELRQLRVGTTLGCAVLFLAGTLTCVVMSAGRNAEATMTKAAEANSANGDRTRAHTDWAEAKASYAAALAAETAECASGAGAKCSAKRITRMVRRGELDEADAKLRMQRPEQIANGDIKHAANLFAQLPFVAAEARVIEATLLLLFPFIQSLFCEIAAIVGFSIALGHRKVKVIEASVVDDKKALPIPEKLSPLKIKTVKDEAEEVIAALKKAGRPVSNEELAGLMAVSPGEASKRVSSLNGRVRRVRVGREVAISL